jgi:hypothetical protein
MHSATTAPSMNRELTVPPVPSASAISHNAPNDIEPAHSKSIAVPNEARPNLLGNLVSLVDFFIGDGTNVEMYINGLVFVICFAYLILVVVVVSRWSRLNRVCPSCSITLCNCVLSSDETVCDVLRTVKRNSLQRRLLGLILILLPVLVVLYLFLDS